MEVLSSSPALFCSLVYPQLPVLLAWVQGMPDYALASAGGHVVGHSQLLQQPASGSGVVGRLASLLNPPALHPLADQASGTAGLWLWWACWQYLLGEIQHGIRADELESLALCLLLGECIGQRPPSNVC